MKTFRQAAATGLVLGAAWGALEALVVLVLPWLRLSLEMGAPRPVVVSEWSSLLLLAALRYALPTLVLALLLAPLARLVFGRGEAADLAQPRAVLAAIVFVNLYWWTKPLFEASWGLPWKHPQRLAMTAGWAALACVVSWLLVRPGGLLKVPGPRAVLATLVLLVAGGGWAHVAQAPPAEQRWAGAEARPPNVLVVVVDALRADRLGCYGHTDIQPPVSPNLDAMAEQAVVFEHMVVQAPFTWTSFGSMLTGKYPRQHGLIKMSPDQKLDTARNRTVAQALDEAGYATGAFLTGTLSNNTGLLRGFDTYFETIVGHEPVNRHSKWSVVRSRLLLSVLYNKLRQAADPRLVNTEALAWIDDHADVPFFAMVHYYSTHTPYDPPEPYKSMYDPGYAGAYHPFFQSHGIWLVKQQKAGVCEHDGLPSWECGHFDEQRDVAHIEALYDGGIAFADEMFGSLLDLLEQRQILDDTLIIFTSDHGEELYDHGVFDHDWMFDTNLTIPFVVRLPGGAHGGTRVPWTTEMLDLPATVLAVTGVGSMQDGDAGPIPSRSLLPDMAGVDPGADAKVAYSENVRYISMVDERWKVTANRFAPDSVRFFDRVEDPDELYPLTSSDPRLVEHGQALLDRLAAYDSSQPKAPASTAKAINPELLKKLATLGYVAGMSDAAVAAAVNGEANAVELLGDTTFVGSNHILEEDLYTWPHHWPPAFEGLGSGRAPVELEGAAEADHGGAEALVREGDADDAADTGDGSR